MRQSAGAANERKLSATISGARNSKSIFPFALSGSFDGLDLVFSKSEARSAAKHCSQTAVQYRTQYRAIGTVELDRPTSLFLC
jgi:hypothetical protein